MNRSKLSSKIKDELLYTEGYKPCRQNRNRHGGGVAVYVTYILGKIEIIGHIEVP